MKRLIEILKTKKGRAAIIGAIAALFFMVTGERVPQEKLDQVDSAIEATVELVEPATAPTTITE